MKAVLTAVALAALSGCVAYNPYAYNAPYGGYGSAPYPVDAAPVYGAPVPAYPYSDAYGYGYGSGYGYNPGYGYGYSAPVAVPYAVPYPVPVPRGHVRPDHDHGQGRPGGPRPDNRPPAPPRPEHNAGGRPVPPPQVAGQPRPQRDPAQAEQRRLQRAAEASRGAKVDANNGGYGP